MNLPASVEGHERLRLFVGLPVPADAAEGLVAWTRGLGMGEARPVVAGNLHLTVAFLGHRPRGDLERVAAVVDELAAFSAPVFGVVRYRETRSVGMLVLEDDQGRGEAIAVHAQRRLAEEGLYAPERRPWLPHVTVLRFRKPEGLRPVLPNVRSIAPSEVAAYLSVLGRGGAVYEVVHSVCLTPA